MKPLTENVKETGIAFYKSDTLYEITLNSDNAHQYLHEINRDKKCVKHYLSELRVLKGYCEYELYLEYSEKRHTNKTDSYARLHYHGTILFKKPEFIGYFLSRLQNMISQTMDIQINEYRPDYWPVYIKKAKGYMEPYLKNERLPYKITHKTVNKVTLKLKA